MRSFTPTFIEFSLVFFLFWCCLCCVRVQNTAVQPYLKTSNLPPRQFWSPNGRAFPDVSASANNVLIFDNGVLYPIGGTSSATPTFAGIVSLLNRARLNGGMPPLGFLNYWLCVAAVRCVVLSFVVVLFR